MFATLAYTLAITASTLLLACAVHIYRVKASLAFYARQGARVKFGYLSGFFEMMDPRHRDNSAVSNKQALYRLVDDGEYRGIIAANMPLTTQCGINIHTSDMVRDMLMQEDSFDKIALIREVTDVTGFFFKNGDEAFRLKAIFSKVFMYDEMTFMYVAIDRMLTGYIEKFNRDNGVSDREFTRVDLNKFFEPVMECIANFVITGEETIEVPDRIKELNRCFEKIFDASFSVITHPLYALLPKLTNKYKLLRFFKTMEIAQKRQIEIMSDLMKEREQMTDLGDCVLDRLIKHNRECTDSEKLSVAEAVGIYNLMYFAGTDTSKATSIMSICHLTTHPDVAECLHRISSQIYDEQGFTSSAKISNSEDLDLFMKETLRLFSPVQQQFAKMAKRDVKIGKFTIRKGDKVYIQISAMHKDKTIFEDPYKFDINRFTRENEKNRPKYQYLPFSIGKRVCMGRHLGELMIKMLLSKLCMHYEFDKPDDVEYYCLSYVTARIVTPVVLVKHRG